ncbi:RNA polymerase sigma factor [Goodfellowiella coeruleoviolacea]|uniref:RNA polymerase sigma-70 factor, ECF subfamily n=1 Tax=Goodfellowiella coeruleoviolacea TaxID=334858 RepID=A0AAE3GMF1_9PSEU|nr:RNA polymerase sigma factor [Goodfellowiella coeruleoviolacea]MCP2170208.1 RNA polymerase sigma-70 factor, ECF subfamily [Goodfellowiella coeruleoviolacea]
MKVIVKTEGEAGPVVEPTARPAARTDAELWERAQNGDRAAFGELFNRHVEALWNHAYRLTASWSQAEDIASNTFLIAWRRRAEITLVRDSALPWLYAVATNLVRGEHRTATRFARLLRRLPAERTEPDHADQVVGRLDGDRRLRAVLAAVDRLPRSEREAVRLCLLGELSTADAAKVLGVAETSVRSRISRARSRLRVLLAEEAI